MTPVEERILNGEVVTFNEALYDCCMHGELSEEQAREWLEGDDLKVALKIIHGGKFLERSPEMKEWLRKRSIRTV